MIVPDALWALMVVFGIVGATAVVTLVVDQVALASRDLGRTARVGRGRARAFYARLHSADPRVLVLVGYVVITVSIIVLQTLMRAPVKDRYLLPLLLPLAVFAARLAGDRARSGTLVVATSG